MSRKRGNKMYRNSILYIVMVVIILSIVIIPTTLFDVMLENDVNGFRAQINDILEMDWNDPELNDKCDALRANWENHMKHWSFVVHHTSIEKVDLGICTFLEFVHYGNYESAAIEAKRLDKIFDMTANQDELSALNIF